jgi:hypothetical protein
MLRRTPGPRVAGVRLVFVVWVFGVGELGSGGSLGFSRGGWWSGLVGCVHCDSRYKDNLNGELAANQQAPLRVSPVSSRRHKSPGVDGIHIGVQASQSGAPHGSGVPVNVTNNGNNVHEGHKGAGTRKGLPLKACQCSCLPTLAPTVRRLFTPTSHRDGLDREESLKQVPLSGALHVSMYYPYAMSR